jgi:AraC-like DNA-binding protein
LQSAATGGDTASVSYLEIAPAPALAPWVECYWRLRSSTPLPEGVRSVLPDGCMDILFSFGDPPRRASGETSPPRFIVGTMTRPAQFVGGGRPDIIGIRFRPGAAPAFLGMPASELTDGSAELEAAWAGRATELWEKLALASDPDRARLLDAVLGALLPGALADADRAVLHAVRLLAQPTWQGDGIELAEEAGLGRRQLERRFRAAVGVSPAAFRRIARARRALAALRERPDGSLASIAVAAGYYDQPHLTRELRALTGRTPGAWQDDASVQEPGKRPR